MIRDLLLHAADPGSVESTTGGEVMDTSTEPRHMTREDLTTRLRKWSEATDRGIASLGNDTFTNRHDLAEAVDELQARYSKAMAALESSNATMAEVADELTNLRAENQSLQAWKGGQQQALIKMSIACLDAGFKGDSVVEGVKWMGAECERLRK